MGNDHKELGFRTNCSGTGTLPRYPTGIPPHLPRDLQLKVPANNFNSLDMIGLTELRPNKVVATVQNSRLDMTADFLIPFITVGLAELGDKTQLSILLISSRTKKHLQLLLGALIAFLIVDGFAVLIGSWVTGIIPLGLLKASSAIVFIAFGLLKLRDDKKESKNRFYSGSPFLSGFVLIALTEWGDKTQIVSGLLAAKYSAIMVLAGTMMALTLLSVLAIWLGKYVSSKIDKKTISRIAGTVFILIGISFLLF